MERREAMRRVRMQVLLVRRLGEQLKAMAVDGLRSPRMDGMPRGTGSAAHGLEVQVEKREALERIIRRESELLREYEEEARRAMDGMRPELYQFCVMYYVSGMSMEDTMAAIDRSPRQCARYKQEIERAESGR